jgi:hypothetical protein
VRVYQFRHLGFWKIFWQIICFRFFAYSPLGFFSAASALGEGVGLAATFAFGDSAGAGDSVGAAVVVSSTERCPVIAGCASRKAESIKTTAAPMVIFDKTFNVPRGPKAVLEMLLVNNAPASALPGCNKTLATKTTQEIKNNP